MMGAQDRNADGKCSLAVLEADLRHQLDRGTDRVERVGIELELLPIAPGRERPTPVSPALEGGPGTAADIAAILRAAKVPFEKIHADEVRFRLPGRAELTFEPGGQIEISGVPHASPADAVADMRALASLLGRGFARRGTRLAGLGCNPWHNVDEIGLQVRKPRYTAMDSYFRGLGGDGVRMMRQTCSLQINLDWGNEDEPAQRWRAANLLCPFLTAAFANSPALDGRASPCASRRCLIWGAVDDTRAGFPTRLLADDWRGDPVEAYLDFALSARVMFLTDPNGQLQPPTEALTFVSWFREGYRSRLPLRADWERHLSTLFPHVRLRDYLEVRYLDCPLSAWMGAPVAVLVALLYTRSGLDWVISHLGRYQSRLRDLLDLAARQGLHDAFIRDTTRAIFRQALELADDGTAPLGHELASVLLAFDRRYVETGRCQADEVREALVQGTLFERLSEWGY